MARIYRRVQIAHAGEAMDVSVTAEIRYWREQAEALEARVERGTTKLVSGHNEMNSMNAS